MNQLTKQLEQDARVRARMLKLLAWDATQLAEVMDAHCLAWLDEVFGTEREVVEGVPTLRRRLEAHTGFRVWWANQWASLDAMLETHLKPVQINSNWLLAYNCPKLGMTMFGSRDAWRTYYQGRHQLFMVHLRPDDEWMGKLVLSIA